jgi:hypothetical protein
MNKLSIKRICIVVFLLAVMLPSGNAQIFHKDPEKKLFGKTHISKKKARVKQPRRVMRAKKKQEANDRRLKKEYEQGVKRSQKRTVDIQSPDVQDRMKKNKKDYTARDKVKRKKARSEARKAHKKYD